MHIKLRIKLISRIRLYLIVCDARGRSLHEQWETKLHPLQTHRIVCLA